MAELGIWVWKPPVDRIHKIAHLTMLSLYFFPSDLQSFGKELNISSKTAHADIWTHKDWQHIIGFGNRVLQIKKEVIGREMRKSSHILFTILYVLLWIYIYIFEYINLILDQPVLWYKVQYLILQKIPIGKCCNLKFSCVVWEHVYILHVLARV